MKILYKRGSVLSEVTVVIPLYNKELFIEKAINSVLNQTYADWKLLIINDCSTDSSVQKVKPYLSDPRISLLSLPHNIGLNQVLNYALTLVTTPYFVQLDADDWLDSKTIEIMLTTAKRNPNVAFFYGNHIEYQIKNGQIKEKIIRKEKQYTNKYAFLSELCYAQVPRFYKTSAVKDTGGWLISHIGDALAEDNQMALRLIGKYKYLWIDEILYHRTFYEENKKSFDRSIPIRRNYVYLLFNQVLKEWGNEFIAVWGKYGKFLELEQLKKNPSIKEADEDWNTPL